HVTGVQTCALPILSVRPRPSLWAPPLRTCAFTHETGRSLTFYTPPTAWPAYRRRPRPRHPAPRASAQGPTAAAGCAPASGCAKPPPTGPRPTCLAPTRRAASWLPDCPASPPATRPDPGPPRPAGQPTTARPPPPLGSTRRRARPTGPACAQGRRLPGYAEGPLVRHQAGDLLPRHARRGMSVRPGL